MCGPGRLLLLLLVALSGFFAFFHVAQAQRGIPRNRSRGNSTGSPTSEGSSGPTPEGEEETGPACQTSTGAAGSCRELAHCIYQFDSLDDLQNSSCQIRPNTNGVCCPTATPDSEDAPPVERPKVRRWSGGNVYIPPITSNDIDISGRRVLIMKSDLDQLESQLVRKGLTVKKGSSESFHLAFFGDKSQAQEVGRKGEIEVEMAALLSTQYNLTSVTRREGLQSVELFSSIVKSSCPRMPRCASTKYRSADGSCNNRNYPDWGKSFTAFNRFLPPDYADGISSPRIASNGGPLPSPRAVSASASPDKDVPHPFLALVIMQWAQFVDHDFSLAAITKTKTGEGILCCDPQIRKDPRLRHPACMEIEIPKDDKFFSQFGQTCMEFVRSLPAPRPGCTLGPKETLNQLTSFIDGSQVYGSTAEETRRLRALNGGRMLVVRHNNADLLPQEKNQTGGCADLPANLFCFRAGDRRVNEQISLTTMHTVWLREHNRIAGIIGKLNPRWTDEIVFQESRRVVAAEIQHITYNEFLPLLLGRHIMKTFGLLLRPIGYSNDYDPSLNPSIANGFATAAYRFGHSLVQGNVNLLNRNGKAAQTVSLASQFFNPSVMYGPGNYDRLIRGLTRQPTQTVDRFVTDQLTNHLFQRPGVPFGLDLIALNIQRGRDNGIPGYNAWRKFCRLEPFKSFDEMIGILNPTSINTFRKYYRNPNDVDLFPAGVGEFSLPGATLGPTFACIVGESFRRLKTGDRFFYENGGMESSFTLGQLREIRRASLARVLCDNSDDIKAMQPIAFIRPSKWNRMMSCESISIPRINFGAWRNEPVWA